ncbi:MAG: FUSC family membrane protein, partial [Bryobacteraceae bacterium]
MPAAAHPQPTRWASFWQMVVRFQADKIAPWLALRNTLGVALPLAAGVAFGAVPAALAVGAGALNVSFSDSDDPYVQRGRRMLAASVLVAIAICAGAICGNHPALAVAAAGTGAFAAGILVALSTAAADLGAVALVTLIVYAAFPMPAEKALFAGLLALAGGLIQTGLALAFWPFGRYAPERRALGELYAEMARSAASPIHSSQAPPASAQSTQAQNSLASLDLDHSIAGERYRSLLNQAERMRVALLTLARLRARLERDTPAGPESSALDRYSGLSATVLTAIARSLLGATDVDIAPESFRELQALADSLRDAQTPARNSRHSVPRDTLISDARIQMDALTGQLRAAAGLAADSTPSGLSAFERREAARPARLRLAGALATLRANLNLESAALR